MWEDKLINARANISDVQSHAPEYSLVDKALHAAIQGIEIAWEEIERDQEKYRDIHQT
jgi:hypothetical protein